VTLSAETTGRVGEYDGKLRIEKLLSLSFSLLLYQSSQTLWPSKMIVASAIRHKDYVEEVGCGDEEKELRVQSDSNFKKMPEFLHVKFKRTLIYLSGLRKKRHRLSGSPAAGEKERTATYSEIFILQLSSNFKLLPLPLDRDLTGSSFSLHLLFSPLRDTLWVNESSLR